MSLLMLDVDDFKAYNDEYGHQAGDDVLIRIAAVCNAAMKRSTDTAARYGGEEFAVILAHTDAEGAMRVAEAIAQGVRDLGISHRRATAAPIVTVSIGVATMMPDARAPRVWSAPPTMRSMPPSARDGTGFSRTPA